MRHDPVEIRKTILAAIPPGRVTSEHTEREHFYRINDETNALYPSVTGALQLLKDEGLINFKMSRALEYVFAHFKEFNDENIMEHIAMAEKMPADIFTDAGDVGTRIHDIRETIFSKWIETGVRPENFVSFIPEHDADIRVESAIAALEKFCIERRYIPIATELKVYSHKLKRAGTLDDLGLMSELVRKGDRECTHMSPTLEGPDAPHIIIEPDTQFERCARCGAKWKQIFVMLDLKTSNRFKDSYFFQVSIYFSFLRDLTGLCPEKCYILKVSKEDRTFKLEDLQKPKKIAQYIKHIVKTNEGLDLIKSLRKDNQRNVISI